MGGVLGCEFTFPPGSAVVSLPALVDFLDTTMVMDIKHLLLQEVYACNYVYDLSTREILGNPTTLHLAHNTLFWHTNLKNITENCQIILTQAQHQQLATIAHGGSSRKKSYWEYFLKRSNDAVVRSTVPKKNTIT